MKNIIKAILISCSLVSVASAYVVTPVNPFEVVQGDFICSKPVFDNNKNIVGSEPIEVIKTPFRLILIVDDNTIIQAKHRQHLDNVNIWGNITPRGYAESIFEHQSGYGVVTPNNKIIEFFNCRAIRAK